MEHIQSKEFSCDSYILLTLYINKNIDKNFDKNIDKNDINV